MPVKPYKTSEFPKQKLILRFFSSAEKAGRFT